MWYETGDDNRKDTNDRYTEMNFFDSGLDITGVEKRGWFKKYWKRMWNLFPRADKEHQAKKGSKDSKLYYFDAYNTTLRNIMNDSEKRKVLNDIREPNHYLGYMSFTHNEYWSNDKFLVIFNWIDGPYAELEFYIINDKKHFNPKQAFYYNLAEFRSQYAFTIIHGDCPIVRALRNHNVDIYYCDVDGLADKIYDKVYNPEYIKWGYKFKGARKELDNLYPKITPEDKNKLFDNMYSMINQITGVMKIDVLEEFVIQHMKSQFLKGRSFDELWEYFSSRTSVLEDEITEAFFAAFPELQAPKQEAIEGSNSTDSGPIAPFRPRLEKEYGLEAALPQNITLADVVNRSKLVRENIIAYELQEDNWKNTNILFKPLKFLYHKITGVEYIKPNTLLTPHQIAILDITIDLLQLKKTALEKGPASWFQISKDELEEYSKKPNALFNFAMISALLNVSRIDGYQQGLEDSLIDISTEKQKVKEAEDIIKNYEEIEKDLKKKIDERDKNITKLTKDNNKLKKEADKVKPLENENKEFKQEIDDLRADRRRILRDKDTNDTALANKNREYEQLEGEKKKKDAEYITLENKYNKLDGEKNATEISLAKKNLEFDDLQEKYTNANKRIDRLKNKKNSYKGWLSGNRTLLHNKTIEYNKLEGDYFEAQEQIANLTEVNNNLIGWLSDNSTYINNVNKNYTAAQAQIENLTSINKNLEDWLSGNTTALVEFNLSTEEQLESQKKYFLGLLTKQHMVIDFVNNSIKWTKDRWDKALAFIDEKIKNTPGNYEHALAKKSIEDFEKYNALKKQKYEDEETIKDLIEQVGNLTTNITTLQE